MWSGKRLIVKNELPDTIKHPETGEDVACVIQVGDIWFLNQKNFDALVEGAKEKEPN